MARQLFVTIRVGMTDEELMMRYVKSEGPAFQELYTRYEGRLQGFLRKRLSVKQRDFAYDLFQITWMKIHQSRKSFDGSQRFAPWLYTIALNTLRDYMREKKHKTEINSENLDKVESDVSGLEEGLLQKEQMVQIEKKLDQLTPSQREVFLLCDFEDFSSKEVALITGLSDGAVRQTLLRARKTLQTIFGDLYENRKSRA